MLLVRRGIEQSIYPRAHSPEIVVDGLVILGRIGTASGLNVSKVSAHGVSPVLDLAI